MTATIYVDVLGWLGSVAVVAAYSLISLQKLRSDSRIYQWLNLVGSVGLAVNTAYFRAYPSTVVNLVWLLIACSALVRIWRMKARNLDAALHEKRTPTVAGNE